MSQLKVVTYTILTIGLSSIVFSIVYSSSILALIGSSLVFWGATLLYIAPAKHVRLDLLSATVIPALANIEKVMTELDLTMKGIYLPPRYLRDIDASLIFIPSAADQALPRLGEADVEGLYSSNSKGVLLVPLGRALLELFEKEIGMSFTRTDLAFFEDELPRLLIEDLEIAGAVDVKVEQDLVTVKVTNHIFNRICHEIGKFHRIHESIGSPLCSAIACVLAKAAGELVRIENEEQSRDGRTTTAQYCIIQEEG